jgi:hypothetical protein
MDTPHGKETEMRGSTVTVTVGSPGAASARQASWPACIARSIQFPPAPPGFPGGGCVRRDQDWVCHHNFKTKT